MDGKHFTKGEQKPAYGHRLIPRVIDEKSQSDPDGEAFTIPRSDNPEHGWRRVSWKEYANSINRTAHKIVEACGEPVPVAAIKAGYKAFFISPRNSHEGQINLFDATDCRFICFPRTHGAMVQPWLQERDMKAILVSPLEGWFPREDAPPFPYKKTFEEAEWDPFLVLHTSGSTGIPKPIICRQGMIAISDAFHYLPEWQGAKPWLQVWTEKSKRQFIPMPLYHAAGIYLFMSSVVYWGLPAALGMGNQPLSTDQVVQGLDNADVESTALPPVILEEMSRDPEQVRALARLNIVAFAGGNLAKAAGDRFFPFPLYLRSDPEIWQYFIINPEVFGCDWRPDEGGDGAYRLVIKRQGEKPGLQGFFYTFPDTDEYDTKDLYKPHPDLPNYWLYYGRSDNIIVFSNGEKLNPITIEGIVEGHPEIRGALVVGSNRFQPALILEPVRHPADDGEARELLDSVWPVVVQANKETVTHGQISRELVVLSNPDKAFPRAGKGTIQRAAAVRLYKDEINTLYEKQGRFSEAEAPRINVESEDALINSIRDVFRIRPGAEGLEPDNDFFSGGVDSLQVISATRLLKSGLGAAGFHVGAAAMATRVIYSNPTPRRLAQYILSIVRNEGEVAPGGEEGHELQAMETLWRKYTSDLPRPANGRPDPIDEGQTVILTGSTGMLGSYMLDLLVRNSSVQKVICLNRADDGGARRQAKAMRERGLASNYSEKTEFYHADMSRSDFGLPADVFERLLRQADRLVHNAWPVNFNIPFESFEPHLRSVRMVADFATRASKRVAVAVISSIGTADRWNARGRGLVPEQRLEDVRLPSNGYGRSKMIGSLILEDAAHVGDFPAVSIRVGQVAGPEDEAGVWNRQEWLPSIVASSVHLGALPSHLAVMERVDWTPSERIACLVLEVLGVTQKLPAERIIGYYHGVNPSETTWGELALAVQQFYGEERISKLVSFSEWVDLLGKSQTDDTQSLEKNPAVKLLDFYRGMASAHEAGHGSVVFDTTRTKECSPTMKATRAITPELMMHWCKQWGF
ncbi:hypothetical protein DL770_002704 [Monosporascus sp. CRB-9-2]|nr:hypothetical protein DL770_002704 [Monosporascus sp. CRB-9-2]